MSSCNLPIGKWDIGEMWVYLVSFRSLDLGIPFTLGYYYVWG